MDDPRDVFISRVVKGKTFADLGGLWGTVNEKVSVAHSAGATGLTMIDRITKEEDDWRQFEERRRSLGLPEVECISKDILSLADNPGYPQYDVVHCAGVLYHIPDPMRLVETLWKITREYVILSSVITPTKVKSDLGTLEVPESCCLFIPALKGNELAIVKSYWQRFVGDGAVGVTRELADWRDTHYVPWWWLPTVEALKSMASAAGFQFMDGAPFWNDNAYSQLLRVRK
jgi:SAM-dependent methyltransferase